MLHNRILFINNFLTKKDVGRVSIYKLQFEIYFAGSICKIIFKEKRSDLDYKYYMGLALEQAKKAFDKGEFPVGCVIVEAGKVIANGDRKSVV